MLRPWLAETLVNSERFAGTCYRAANWLDVGMTTGRGRQDRDNSRYNGAPKRIFVYPLRPDAQQILASGPQLELLKFRDMGFGVPNVIA